MVVVPSQLATSGAVPSSPLAVRALQYLHRPDWADTMRIQSSWKTSVVRSLDGHEQRRGYVSRPSYGLSASFWGLADENRLRTIRSWQERTLLSRSLVPLYPDKVRVTNIVSNTISGNFAHRRFFEGQRIALASSAYDLRSLTTIVSVTPTSLTVASASGGVIGGWVIPLSEGEAVPSLSGQIVTGSVINADLNLEGTFGPSSLDPLQTPGNSPSEWPTYCTIPIWHPPRIDWALGVTYSINSALTLGLYGLGNVPSLYPSPTWVGLDFSVLHLDRESFWNFRKLWDYAAGQLFPFIFVEPTIDLFAVEPLPNGMRFRATGLVVDWDSVQYIAFINRGSNPVQIRKVASVTSSGGGEFNDVVFSTEDGDGPFTDLDLEIKFAVARKMRFASDTLTEEWITDEICRIPISLIEVPREESVIVPNLDLATDTSSTCTATTGPTSSTSSTSSSSTSSSSTSWTFTDPGTFTQITSIQ